MVHPVAYSGLSGQTQVVGSYYCAGIPAIAGMPISAPVVTSVSTRASTKADVHPRDYSAPTRSETTDTLLRDRRLAQYAAKERRENTNDELALHVDQFDDADREETGGRFSSQAGILRGAGHGWIPYPDIERRPGHRPYARSESRRTPYQQRVYGPFANPSRMAREEYNDCNYRRANNVCIGDEPVVVNAPYRGETDEGRRLYCSRCTTHQA